MSEVRFSGGRLAPAHAVIERALETSNASGSIVIVYDRTEAEVRFANNTTTTNGNRSDRRIVVVSTRERTGGTSVGVASASGAADVADLVRAADAESQGADVADDASPLLDGGVDPDLDKPVEAQDLERLDHVVASLAAAFDHARKGDRVLAGFAEHSTEVVYVGSSTGTRIRHVQPTGRLQLVSRSSDGTRSAWAGVGSADLETADLGAIEEQLAQRLGWAEKHIELEPGRYDVVLPADAVADLMTLVLDAASGRDAEDGRSVFSAPGGKTRIGDVLSSLSFELRSDPAEPGLECSPFLAVGTSGTDVSVFDNGLHLERTKWIEGGKLERLQYHRAGARKSGAIPTPPIDNLVLELPGAATTAEEMVRDVERGLLLTCLWYIRTVDPSTLLLTGLTRDGVYVIENGRIVGATNNFRWNESPVDLLRRATVAGRTRRALSREFNEYLPRTAMPPLRVPDFNMSSVSKAT
ncbi:MAG TPA: metallopeptidase TldD-related protein [Acidimicrobiales bacterium]|nr:metallopeptidase TldD-related protein [Acidimicrobiales bacterium]